MDPILTSHVTTFWERSKSSWKACTCDVRRGKSKGGTQKADKGRLRENSEKGGGGGGGEESKNPKILRTSFVQCPLALLPASVCAQIAESKTHRGGSSGARVYKRVRPPPGRMRRLLPDCYSHIFRSYVIGSSGFWTMAPLSCAANFDPFLSLDCAPTPSTLAQSKERKGSNFAVWQP